MLEMRRVLSPFSCCFRDATAAAGIDNGADGNGVDVGCRRGTTRCK